MTCLIYSVFVSGVYLKVWLISNTVINYRFKDISKMPMSCLICGNEGEKGFFQFPGNKDRRSQWVEILRLDPYFIDNNKRFHKVCHLHFRPEDIYPIGERLFKKKGMFLWILVFICFYLRVSNFSKLIHYDHYSYMGYN